MAVLHIKSLQCNTTEDAGGDECELRVWVDEANFRFRKNMKNGENWIIDFKVPIKRRAKIQLYDLDTPKAGDDHDLLGLAVLRPDPLVDDASVTFNEDESDYELTYSVLA